MSSYHPENDPANPDRPGTADAPQRPEGTEREDSASTHNTDKMNFNKTGLDQCGGVPPGETPPAEDQMSGDQGHGE